MIAAQDAPRHIPQPKKKIPTAAKWAIGIGAVMLALCLVGVSLMAILGVAADEINKDIESTLQAKRAGVSITSCNLAEIDNELYPRVQVALKVINTTPNQQTYSIDVFVKDAKGTRVGDGYAVIANVRPGQTTTGALDIDLQRQWPAGTKLACSVDKVG